MSWWGLTNLGGIVRSTKNELGSAIVSRANVGDVRLILHENFCTTKITQLQDAGGGVQQQVLRLDISVADALRVDICKRSE